MLYLIGVIINVIIVTKQTSVRETENSQKNFIKEVEKYISFYQFLFIFGGEPTLFPEFISLLEMGNKNTFLRYGTVSNGSLLHKYFENIEKVNWAFYRNFSGCCK